MSAQHLTDSEISDALVDAAPPRSRVPAPPPGSKEIALVRHEWDELLRIIRHHAGTLAADRRRLTGVDKWGRPSGDSRWRATVHEFMYQVLPTLMSFARIPRTLRERVPDIIEEILVHEALDSPTRFVDSASLDAMSGIEFEYHCADMLRRAGWSVRSTPTTGDQGIDLIATRDGATVAFQCKRYSSAVGNKAVQEAAAGSRFYGCTIAAVVTNASYTRSAVALANSLGVFLLSPEQIADFLPEVH